MAIPLDDLTVNGRAWALVAYAQAQTKHAAKLPPLDRRALPMGEALAGYEVIEQVSSGGQGIVYRAMQQSTGRLVAIKVLRDRPLARQQDLARFEREVEILGRLNHEYIVGILDSGLVHGNHYFVMDFVDGDMLDQHVHCTQPSLLEALADVAQII